MVAALILITAVATAWSEPVKITFVPPPVEGTISLGVYNAAGKLVRVLKHEAEESEFTAGDDGFVTEWDGKDDTGAPCPSGTYRARGVVVGDLAVEGVDFIGNDWVTGDDSPHVSRITALSSAHPRGEPVLAVLLAGSSTPSVYHLALKMPELSGEASEVQLVENAQDAPWFSHLSLDKPKDIPSKGADFGGPHNTLWVIQKGIVKEYSKNGELLRTLASKSDDPPAVRLTSSFGPALIRGASPDSLKGDPRFGAFANGNQLCVLYENDKLQRLRGYDFTGVKPGDAPKELFENDILANNTYEQIASELQFPDGTPFVPSPLLTVSLAPNPLANNKQAAVDIRAGVDKEGSYLATADGLLLCHISDTPNVRWAVMGQPVAGKAAKATKDITFFDSDGAVVEEFRIANPDNLTIFDAGALQWNAPAASSATPAAPAPTAAASPAAPSPSPAN